MASKVYKKATKAAWFIPLWLFGFLIFLGDVAGPNFAAVSRFPVLAGVFGGCWAPCRVSL